MAADRWAPWRFLIGEWTAVPTGTPGEAEAGGATFALELDGSVLCRRSFARYAATAQRAAHTHEDLLYLYPDGASWRGVYLDNEGHVLHYRAESDGARARLETDTDGRGMRFRLTYEPHDAALAVSFAIAPPGGDFATHVSGRMERARSAILPSSERDPARRSGT